jgi:hypothetical protein
MRARRPILLLALLALLATALPAATAAAVDDSTDVWINEFHYDNVSTDTGEFIEVAFADGTDLTGWSIVRYNGATPSAATVYTTPSTPAENDLGALTPSAAVDGIRFVVVNYPPNGLQNGGNDGFALVDDGGEVVQLLSYEGTFTASNGPAAGLTSTDVGISQSGTEPVGASLQLSGTGLAYGDFDWTSTTANTAGRHQHGSGLRRAERRAPGRSVRGLHGRPHTRERDPGCRVEHAHRRAGRRDARGCDRRLHLGRGQRDPGEPGTARVLHRGDRRRP